MVKQLKNEQVGLFPPAYSYRDSFSSNVLYFFFSNIIYFIWTCCYIFGWNFIQLGACEKLNKNKPGRDDRYYLISITIGSGVYILHPRGIFFHHPRAFYSWNPRHCVTHASFKMLFRDGFTIFSICMNVDLCLLGLFQHILLPRIN